PVSRAPVARAGSKSCARTRRTGRQGPASATGKIQDEKQPIPAIGLARANIKDVRRICQATRKSDRLGIIFFEVCRACLCKLPIRIEPAFFGMSNQQEFFSDLRGLLASLVFLHDRREAFRQSRWRIPFSPPV